MLCNVVLGGPSSSSYLLSREGNFHPELQYLLSRDTVEKNGSSDFIERFKEQ